MTLRVEKPGAGDSQGGPNSAVDFERETKGFAKGRARAGGSLPRSGAAGMPVRGNAMRFGMLACAMTLAALATGPALGRGADREEALQNQFKNEQWKVTHQAGTRYVEVGVWCRKAGLVTQATNEFLRAVEVSEGKNHWANKVVELMRNLDDKFWKEFKNEKPSKGMLAAYEKRVKSAASAHRRDQLSLAKWAEKQDLEQESYAAYMGVVRAAGSALEFDAQGRVVVEGVTLPEKISARLREDAVTINDRLYVRDEFLELVPEVKTVHQVESDAVRLRTEKDAAQAKDLHALATAAFPLMEDEVGGRPTSRLTAYVFQDRAVYDSYLRKTSLGSHTVAPALADSGRKLVLICSQGLNDEAVRGILLHELAHLFQYSVTPTIMPSWYSEGFADSFGGVGAYEWNGAVLKCGRNPPQDRIAPLATDEGYIPLTTLLGGDALDLITKDRALAGRFYLESRAFYRFMKTAAPKDIRDAFSMWEAMCKGAALGAEAGKPYNRNAGPAANLFKARFGSSLPKIEMDFRAWLAK